MNELFEEFRIAIHSVWQRRWMALGIAWGIAALGWLVVALIPNSYQSEARVLVESQAILADQTGVSQGDRQREIDRIEQTLTSQANLEKVVRSTALGQDLATQREVEGAVNGLRNAIEIRSDADNLFEISARIGASGRSDGEAAALARDIVQKLIDIFAEDNLAADSTETSQTLKFLDEQLAKRQQALDAAGQKRAAFEVNNLGLLPGAGSIGDRMAAARSELGQIDTQLIAAQSALGAINSQLAATPATIAVPGAAGGARGALVQLQGELASARARGLTEQHPDIVALRNQIAALQAQAANEPAGAGGTPNPAYSSLQGIRAERQANVTALQARKSVLQSDLAAMTAKQIDQPGLLGEQARLNRDYDVLKDQYDKLLADREQLRLRGDVESGTAAIRFELIAPPSSPRTPVAPNRPLLLALVLFAAIAGGAGAAFAHAQLRAGFVTAARLQEAFDLPVIGSVSQMLTNAQRAERQRRLRLFLGSSGALVAVFLMLLMVEFIQRGSVA